MISDTHFKDYIGLISHLIYRMNMVSRKYIMLNLRILKTQTSTTIKSYFYFFKYYFKIL